MYMYSLVDISSETRIIVKKVLEVNEIKFKRQSFDMVCDWMEQNGMQSLYSDKRAEKSIYSYFGALN